MIKGFDDQLRIQRLGKIRLGVKKTAQSGSEYPSAVDYFVCPPEVQRVYGEKPRELEIMLPHDAIEEVFPTALKRYGSGQGLMCRGNGEKAECRDADSEEWHSRDCLYQQCEHYENGDCKEVGNLQVILPEVKGALGIYQIDTSSYNSIMNIKSGLEMLRSTVGRISLIPLTLEVRMQEANPMTSKGRIRTNVPVMFLRFDHTFYEVLDMAKDRQLVQQINTAGMAGPALQVDNEGLDEKPELLYPNQLEEGKDAGSQAEQAAAEDAGGDAGPDESKEDEVDDPRLKRARNLMERLGWPPAKQKAVLGKPDLNVQELLEGLRAEVVKRHKEQGREPSRRRNRTRPRSLRRTGRSWRTTTPGMAGMTSASVTLSAARTTHRRSSTR